MLKRDKDEEVVIKFKTTKYKIAFIIIILYIVNYAIRLSDLIKIYEINFITNIIMKNGVNLFLLVIILCFMNFIEKKKFQEELGGKHYE